MFIIIHKKTITILCVILVVIFSISGLFISHSISKAAEETYIQLPIIMYHHISKKSSLLNQFTISDTQFEQDLMYLKEHGFTTVSMADIIAYKEHHTPLPNKPIMITFDDGFESFYQYAYPLLNKYQDKAILSITGKYVDQFTKANDHNVDYSYLTWQEVAELNHSSLVEIGNHTYDMHVSNYLRHGCKKNNSENPETYKKLLRADLQTLQTEMKEHTNFEPTIFTYPFGFTCSEATEVVKSMGFKAALTCDGRINELGKKEDWIYHLGRFNRPNGVDTNTYFCKILKGYEW